VDPATVDAFTGWVLVGHDNRVVGPPLAVILGTTGWLIVRLGGRRVVVVSRSVVVEAQVRRGGWHDVGHHATERVDETQAGRVVGVAPDGELPAMHGVMVERTSA
jgi:hypothetical protein